MKTYTGDQLRQILYSTQPILAKFTQAWEPDSVYCDVDPEVIRKVAQTIDPRLKKVDGQGWDCDNIALKITVAVKEYCYLNNISPYDVENAIGFGLGMKWNGVEENHTANIFVFEDIAYAYDGQLDSYWPLTTKGDLIYMCYI